MASNAKNLAEYLNNETTSATADIADGSITTAKLADGGVTTAKVADNAITSAKALNFGRRNLVINGGMQVAQRSTSVSGLGGGSGGYQTLDRFRMAMGATSAGRYTMSQSTVTDLEGFSKALKIDCTTADTSIAAGEALILQQRFEGQNLQSLKASSTSTQAFTISFYAKSNASRAIATEINFVNGTNRAASKLHTIGTSWARYTMTIAAASSTQIDDDNSHEMDLNFWIHAGSTYTSGTMSGTLGAITNANRAAGIGSIFASTSNTLEITGVQIEKGSAATDFEHRFFAEELSLCQRYFEKMLGDNATNGTSGYVVGAGLWYGAGQVLADLKYKVIKRAQPTIALSNAQGLKAYTSGAARTANDATPCDQIREQNARLNLVGWNVNGTAGYGALVQLVDTHSITMDAEL